MNVPKKIFIVITFLFSIYFITGCSETDNDNDSDSLNYPPTIQKIKGYGNEIRQGYSTPLQASVKDYENDPLEYTWESTAGEFDNTSQASVNWTAPNTPGDVTITISVNDGESTSTRKIKIKVIDDTQIESEIIGNWNLVSIDNHYLPYIEDETLGATTKHVSLKHTYQSDGTYITNGEQNYIFSASIWIIEDEMYPLSKGVNISFQYEVTGQYSLEGSEPDFTISKSVGRFQVVDANYDKERYTDVQIAEIEDLIQGVEKVIREITTTSEPIEITIEDNQISATEMPWLGESVYEKVLVELKLE